MKLSFVEMSGFRGYRDQVRIEFGSDITIIDGRNGVGKSTIFDAVEYALTGSIAKYQEATANRENVDDYIWWIGNEQCSDERYVKVGFIENDLETVIKRTSLQPENAQNLELIANKLFDQESAPSAALQQLCKSTIIRDELIAALSLDLKETERYSLLSSAIGAVGSDEWIKKAKDIYDAAVQEKRIAAEDSQRTKDLVVKAQIRIDQLRAKSQDNQQLISAVAQLEELLDKRILPENAVETANEKIENLQTQYNLHSEALQALRKKAEAEMAFQTEANNLNNLEDYMQDIAITLAEHKQELAKLDSTDASTKLAAQLNELASLGEQVGLTDDKCPLCKSSVNNEQYIQGIDELRRTSTKINDEITKSTELKNQISDLETKLTGASSEAVRIEQKITYHEEAIQNASHLLDKNFPKTAVTEQSLINELSKFINQIEKINEILPRIDIATLQSDLRSTASAFERLRSQDQQADKILSFAEQKESDTKKLYDAVKKAANDAFNQRLERVLPLITELYSRLRPHPNFQEIDAKIRGELRGFLSFQVGKNVNPQFIYSSGQRRATGLAFLISVNLSMAWNRWSSLLLDDPVQHIDDFRSVHLAELLGQLVREKKQVICAVEDPALAELLCRKMPVLKPGSAKRITLGVNEMGRTDTLSQYDLTSMQANVLQNNTSGLAV